MTEIRTRTVAGAVSETTIFVRLFTALRIFTGLVWLSNGLAKRPRDGSGGGGDRRPISS